MASLTRLASSKYQACSLIGHWAKIKERPNRPSDTKNEISWPAAGHCVPFETEACWEGISTKSCGFVTQASHWVLPQKKRDIFLCPSLSLNLLILHAISTSFSLVVLCEKSVISWHVCSFFLIMPHWYSSAILHRLLLWNSLGLYRLYMLNSQHLTPGFAKGFMWRRHTQNT